MAALPPALRDLSVDEKCDLIDALWFDIEAESNRLSEAQLQELDRRLSHYQQHPSDAVPWEQVRATVLKR